MPISTDGHTTSTDDHSACTNCHYHSDPRDHNGYTSGADRNSDSHCDSPNTNNDGDDMDDSDSESGSKLSESW